MSRQGGSGKSGGKGERQARLAEELRSNLARRKAQLRSRRAGEADRRPEGLQAGPADDAAAHEAAEQRRRAEPGAGE